MNIKKPANDYLPVLVVALVSAVLVKFPWNLFRHGFNKNCKSKGNFKWKINCY